MIFHIAVCSPDAGLRSGLERQCMEYFARRADACIVQQLPDAATLLQRDTAGDRYELYLIELAAVASPEGLAAAAELRRRGRRAPLAFVARTPAHAYSAFRVDAMQYLLLPVHQQELSALLDRAAEPEYGPALTVNTAGGLRVLAYAEIEYLECTHHIVHFHLLSGEDVTSLSLRVPFSAVAGPLLADGRFLQPHRSYVVSLAAVRLLSAGELQMTSGARVPSPVGGKAPCGKPSAPGTAEEHSKKEPLRAALFSCAKVVYSGFGSSFFLREARAGFAGRLAASVSWTGTEEASSPVRLPQ